MGSSQPVPSTVYSVSRSRGKKKGESSVLTKYRQCRREKGMAHESDESEPEEELQAGAVILHQLFHRKVIYYPDDTVVKSGPRIPVGESEALKIVEQVGIPAPRLRDVQADNFRMTFVPGKPLSELWADLPNEQRKDIILQLREMLIKMRAVSPPPGSKIGACDGSGIRDTRALFTYHAPPCDTEEEFNQYLLSSLHAVSPTLLRDALAQRLKTNHRIVLTHCDLCPRNIMVQDGKITGLIDWEDSGWYPEYWEYIKFFERSGTEKGWKEFAGDIFAELYPNELVDLVAFSKYQKI